LGQELPEWRGSVSAVTDQMRYKIAHRDRETAVAAEAENTFQPFIA
jgi:hypothetical protein